MKRSILYLIIIGSLILTGCKETTVVNEVPNTRLIITSIKPERGGPGMIVEIEGLGFSSTTEENMVIFNGVTAEVEAASHNRIITTVPEGVSTGPVQVQVAEGTAIGPVFTLDERLAFVGEYVTMNYEMRFVSESFDQDTVININGNSKINVTSIESSHNQMEVTLGDLTVNGLFQVNNKVLGANITPEIFQAVFEDKPIATASGSKFELNDTTFELIASDNGEIITLPGVLLGDGLLSGDSVQLIFSYKILIFGSFSGEVMLERQE